MRTAKKTVPTLDLFRLAAVLLVVMNHTSPLADVSSMAEFLAYPGTGPGGSPILSDDHWVLSEPESLGWCGAAAEKALPALRRLHPFVSASESLCRQLHRSGGCFAGTAGGRHLLPPVVFPGDHSGHRHRPVAQPAGPAGGSACGGATLSHRSGRGQLLWTGFPDPAASDPLRRHFYTVRLYPQWPVLRATVPSAWGRRKAVEPKAVSGGLLPLSGSHERRGAVAPSHGCPAPRQHVPRPPPVHSMPFFSAAGRKQGRVQESPGIFHSHVCAPSPLHRTGPGSGKATGTGRNAH